jgi:hypothetical protein
MPALVTKTVRVRSDQESKMCVDHHERSSFLIRKLLDIFWESKTPGLDLVALRTNIKLPESLFRNLK